MLNNCGTFSTKIDSYTILKVNGAKTDQNDVISHDPTHNNFIENLKILKILKDFKDFQDFQRISKNLKLGAILGEMNINMSGGIRPSIIVNP